MSAKERGEQQHKSVTVTVIGAGVVGLTTALILQRQPGVNVTIVAEYLPEPGQENVFWTSPWAGAHFRSTAGKDKRLQKYDEDTFNCFWALKDQAPETGIMELLSIEYFDKKPPAGEVWYKHVMPEYKEIEKEKLLPGVVYGVQYKTFSVPPHKYLPYLLSQFREAGGKIVQRRIFHIDEILKPVSVNGVCPDVVVNCAGIGARFLGGVEDSFVYPTRGQTVLVRDPKGNGPERLSTTIARIGKDYITYMIPRSDGNVILGGTMDANVWEQEVVQEISENIAKRCVEILPDLLLTPNKSLDTSRPVLSQLDVVKVNVGFRPSRRGGVRVDYEWREGLNGKPVVLQHNYGHGGTGYQSSWGTAFEAARNIAEAMGIENWNFEKFHSTKKISKL